MPHSVTPDSSPPREENDTLPDAPADNETLPNADSQEQGLASSPSAVVDQGSDASAAIKPTANELESMFDDLANGEEDEFNSSAPPMPSLTSANYSDPEIMRAFYQRLFPFRYLFQWLNHAPNPTNDFAHREFAFTLPGDIYLRYQSFVSADLLRKQCIAQNPSRFEIGPVYTTNPRDRKTLRRAAAFRPLTRELVFDIDMNDYDEIRTCCTGAKICHRCWSFIRMAIKVVDVALREDFGFKHILWVYSGRRGIHGWVCDKRARELDDTKRRAIAVYMELLKGGDQGGKKVNVKRPLHPHLDRSLRILREHFQGDILQDQDPWYDSDKASHLLGLLPDKQLAQSLAKKWESSPSRSSSNKWADIDALASSGGASASLDTKKLLEAKQDIVLEYTYPRLDAEVSKHLNHLLKSPFCVHPATGRICVPVDPKNVDNFDPLDVPTVTELLGQIDEWAATYKDDPESDGKKIQDWEKTRLKPYVDYFRHFVAVLLKDEQAATSSKRRREETAGDPMEF